MYEDEPHVIEQMRPGEHLAGVEAEWDEATGNWIFADRPITNTMRFARAKRLGAFVDTLRRMAAKLVGVHWPASPGVPMTDPAWRTGRSPKVIEALKPATVCSKTGRSPWVGRLAIDRLSYPLVMADQSTRQTQHSWAVYHIAAKQKFIGIVSAPNADAAIKAAIDEYKVPANIRDRLIAQRRD